jgi:putative ABC transport system permease protein
MTWTSELPEGNDIVEGQWFSENEAGFSISIEERMANKLDLKIGDTLDFMIGSQAWSAPISSIRYIDWQNFSPNFYIVATPGALDDFSATYISSFYLPEKEKPLLFQLVKDYPSVTLVDLAKILEEIQTIISKLAKAIEFIMLFVVIAGLALLKATMDHSFDKKYKQSAILRTLGASKRFINQSFRFQSIWLALLTALMVLGMIELVTYYLYEQVFEISYEFHYLLWLVLPPITLALMLLGSWLGVNKITQAQPLSLIRQN